jgi:hypothetical protein
LNVRNVGISVLICLALAACAGGLPASDDNNTIVTQSGKVVQAPPVHLRLGNTGGESGGSAGRN